MPLQERSRATFDIILDATARILEDLGYAALTTNGVAAVAGVGIGTVYEYFPNKETIVAELVRRTCREIVQETEDAFTGAKNIDSKDKAIEQLVRSCLHVLRKRRALVQVFVEQVSYFWDVDEFKSLPMKLFEIVWRSRALAKSDILDGNYKAMSYAYLLIPIGRWVSYAAIVNRPHWLSEKDAEDAAVEIFKRLLR